LASAELSSSLHSRMFYLVVIRPGRWLFCQ